MLGMLIGLVVLIVDVWAILNTFQSNASTNAKIGWTVLILIFPFLGAVIWFVAGPRSE